MPASLSDIWARALQRHHATTAEPIIQSAWMRRLDSRLQRQLLSAHGTLDALPEPCATRPKAPVLRGEHRRFPAKTGVRRANMLVDAACGMTVECRRPRTSIDLDMIPTQGVIHADQGVLDYGCSSEQKGKTRGHLEGAGAVKAPQSASAAVEAALREIEGLSEAINEASDTVPSVRPDPSVSATPRLPIADEKVHSTVSRFCEQLQQKDMQAVARAHVIAHARARQGTPPAWLVGWQRAHEPPATAESKPGKPQPEGRQVDRCSEEIHQADAPLQAARPEWVQSPLALTRTCHQAEEQGSCLKRKRGHEEPVCNAGMDGEHDDAGADDGHNICDMDGNTIDDLPDWWLAGERKRELGVVTSRVGV